SSTSTRHPTKAATPASAPASPTPFMSPRSSGLARASSSRISGGTVLAAKATRSPSDWSPPTGSGVSLRAIVSLSRHASHRPPSARLPVPVPDVPPPRAGCGQGPRLTFLLVVTQYQGPIRRFTLRRADRQLLGKGGKVPRCVAI